MLLVPVAVLLLQDKVGTKHYIDPARPAKPSKSVLSTPKILRDKGPAPLKAPSGVKINVFADELFFPRNLAVAPNGDVFVIEAEGQRVTLLRDTDGDGKMDVKRLFASGLRGPHGIAFHANWLYVANTDKVVRFAYKDGQLRAEVRPETVVPDLPAEKGYNMHWTRNIAFSPDGKRMIVTVGSATNNDIEPLPRGAILSYTPDGNDKRILATGLRNPVGLRFRPGTSELWASCIERDFLGGDCPPDFITKIEPGQFYGWPWFYIGTNRDPKHTKHKPPRKDVSIPTILAEAHSIPLGIHFYGGAMFPEYRGDLFAAMRGSTNRVPRSGYKVVHFKATPNGIDPHYEDFVVGWVPDRFKRDVYGRPVAIAEAKDGALLIVDEPGHKIWRLSKR